MRPINFPAATKASLRCYVRERVEKMDASSLQRASQQILLRLERLPEFLAARSVLLYWSLPSEVSTHAFVERWAPQKRILLPVMQGEGLVLRAFEGRERMRECRFGVWEPIGDEEGPGQTSRRVRERAEVMVIPGVGFDPAGNRLGHGKGFYDRLLAQKGVLKIGVCFDFQLFEEVPRQDHDVAMDRVICGNETESVLYICEENKKP